MKTSKSFTALLKAVYKIDKTAAVLLYINTPDKVKICDSCTLINVFTWYKTKQGHKYWDKICCKLPEELQ